MITSEQLHLLPTSAGVYIYKDTNGRVLYVGKAKRLRTRVRSYFRPQAALDEAKTQMVKQIATIETIATDTETEALILEANLIRQHQPPYNVVLRDDKYYLFIKITKEDYPRVVLVRRITKDGARYFGPYSSAHAVRATLRLLKRLFPHRGEQSPPPGAAVKAKGFSRDFNFPHPLFSQLSADDRRQYQENIRHVIAFLQGKRDEIVKTLQAGMREAAAHNHFERAAIFRDQIRAIERLDDSQKVHLPSGESFDVVSIAQAALLSAANVFSIRRGKLLHKNTFLLRHRRHTRTEDIVRQFLLQYYRVAQNIPATIYIPVPLDDLAALATWINNTTPPTFLVPQRGVKRQLLLLGQQNALHLLRQEEAQGTGDAKLKQARRELAALFGPKAADLSRIEIYDISNIQGQLPTASMAVFIDGRAAPQHYRKFRLAAAEKPNDFAMMQEVLKRRFSGRHEDWKIPNLIIVDGGKGQLSAAAAALQEVGLDVPLAALAKREEELFIPGQAAAVRFPYDSSTLYLLQRMRDEAHRFTVTYHRLLRSKQQRRSLLDEIPGIGPKTKRQLITHFGSLKAIRAATAEELADVVGPAKAQLVKEYL